MPAPTASLSGDDCALFCSDIHLHEQQPALARRFFAQLTAECAQASHLFVLGDLFEAWVGDDQADPVSLQALALLNQIALSGVKVAVMRGNRDFLIGAGAPAGFDWSAHLQLLADQCLIDAWGEPVLLAHGDQYCVDDVRYQAFRTERNSAAWRAEFLARNLSERLELARQMRAQSAREKADKSQYLMDVNLPAVEQAMVDAGVRCLIHGHTHRPALHQSAIGGAAAKRWVLPDWQQAPERGGFLRVNRAGFEQTGCWR